VGIVLKRYAARLSERIQDEKPKDFDQAACMRTIESGIKHLRSLDPAQNDLNPENIMLEDSDGPRIIDLGSCRPPSDALITAGTVRWTDEIFVTSATEHDLVGLRRVEAWMREQPAGASADGKLDGAGDQDQDEDNTSG